MEILSSGQIILPDRGLFSGRRIGLQGAMHNSVRLNLRSYRESQQIVEHVFTNFCDKNAVLTNFREKQQWQISLNYHQRMEILSLKRA